MLVISPACALGTDQMLGDQKCSQLELELRSVDDVSLNAFNQVHESNSHLSGAMV